MTKPTIAAAWREAMADVRVADSTRAGEHAAAEMIWTVGFVNGMGAMLDVSKLPTDEARLLAFQALIDEAGTRIEALRAARKAATP